METKHTPGPFVCGDTDDTTMCIWTEEVDESGQKIVAEAIADDVPFEECVANARLIAASPELLYALKFCRSVISIYAVEMSEQRAIELADAAIAKATGK